MATIGEVAREPVEQRLARMERTADHFAAAIQGVTEAVLSRRPDEKNWAAKEIVCHLRDIEELWTVRAQTVLLADDQMFLRNYPDRWVQERQCLRNDAAQVLAAFRIRRREALELFRKLSATELQRTCNHAVLGRITIDRIVGLIAWHDDNHLDQLEPPSKVRPDVPHVE